MPLKRPSISLPLFAIFVVLQFTFDHADHYLITDQTTLVHYLLGFPPKRGLLRYLISQHVPRCLEENVSLRGRIAHTELL